MIGFWWIVQWTMLALVQRSQQYGLLALVGTVTPAGTILCVLAQACFRVRLQQHNPTSDELKVVH